MEYSRTSCFVNCYPCVHFLILFVNFFLFNSDKKLISFYPDVQLTMSGLFYFLEIINQAKLAIDLNKLNVELNQHINFIKLKGKDFALLTKFLILF